MKFPAVWKSFLKVSESQERNPLTSRPKRPEISSGQVAFRSGSVRPILLVKRPLPEDSISESAFASTLRLLPPLVLFFALLIGLAIASEDHFRDTYNLPRSPEPVLKEVLSRPEFKEDAAQSLIERLWNQLREELVRLLARIFRRLPLPEGYTFPQNVGRTLVTAMLLGSAGLLAVFVLIRVFRLARRKRTPSENDSSAAQLGASAASGSEEFRAEALRLAEKGNYSQALIHLFRSALLRLKEKGFLSFHKGKTNREILESINDDLLRGIIADMIPSFNQVRYGNASCDHLEYERFLGLCLRLTERV